MEPKTLRLRASGDALLSHYESMANGVRRFVGREYKEIEPGVWGFAPKREPEEVPNRAEYREAVQAGDAEPADEATAKACRVPWQSSSSPKRKAADIPPMTSLETDDLPRVGKE
jgi:hypothetical protein